MTEPTDKRKHARIESSIVCSLATGSEVFDGVVANLSKGGALIIASRSAAVVGDTVMLMLEREEGLLTLSLPGSVVRKDEDEQHGRYGVEFEPLPPADEAQLAVLLQLLLNGRGQGRREHPRIAARIEVVCRTEELFRGWVNNLSKGGLSLKSLKDVAVGQPIEVSFGVRGLHRLVEITAEVVSNQPAADGFRLGLKFTPLTETEQAQVHRTLSLLLDIALPDAELVPEDEG